jgi:plasmid segregation protein ParM
MKKMKVIGVDVGNFDVKTQNTTFPSGFEVVASVPYGVTEYLKYNGQYYIPSDERFPYVRNKAENENCFILTLMAISKELIFCATQASEDKRRRGVERNVQEELADVEVINLGVGLPPTHMSGLSDKLINYYRTHFKDSIVYEFSGYNFKFSVEKIRCYPQDMAALVTYKPKDRQNSAISYDTYCGIDIGGWTLDVVTIRNKKVVPSLSNSLEFGILSLYKEIEREFDNRFSYRPTKHQIESYLRGGKVLFSVEQKVFVETYVKNWYDKMINTLTQTGINIMATPIVFIGGGSLLFEKHIVADKRFALKEFIYNPRANAQAYATILEFEK